MRKDNITLSQAVFALVLFMFGSSVVVGISSEAGQDAWLSVLLAAAMAIPVLFVYARIMRLFPETDLFEILEILYGKIFGKVIILLITWYALHLCSLVVRNFTEFLQIVSMPETPQLPMMITLVLVTAYLSRSGVSVLGKWSMIMFPVVIMTVVLTVILALSDIDPTNVEPILAKGMGKVVTGAYQTMTFPYAETVLFLCLAHAVKRETSPYKIYGVTTLITTCIFLLVMFRNIMVLGIPMVRASYFPSYTTARILHVGDFLSRIEGSITFNFLLAGIVKVTVCLLAASRGIAKLFAVQDYKRIIMPTGMLVVALCAIVYKSTMEMFGFLKYYQFYAIPFQFIIPLAVWITAEIKTKKRTA